MEHTERFWLKVDRRGPDECWPWLAGTSQGYGYAWNGTGLVRAHVFSWQAENGPVPEGHEIHHLCRNPSCVNPAHLRALTPMEHAAEHRKTHCKRGHEFTPANTYRRRNGSRLCRECVLQSQRNGRETHGEMMARFTHCRVGHPYSGENLRIDAKGGRDCRECGRFRSRLRHLWKRYA